MVSGGARNRSGPQPDPSSGRSDRKGLVFSALPAEGWSGPVPAWPLPRLAVFFESFEDGKKVRVFDESETERVAARERELWGWAWGTPQACAWAQPSESWRLMSIAMWVRTYVVCEGPGASAADKGSLHRFADQVGLTPAGLRENGWAVAADEVAVQRSAPTAARARARDRLKAVGG